MSTIELTADNFNEVISGNDFVIIDFWAEWCGPCRKFGPVFERVSDKHEGVVFAKVDTEAQRELAQAFEITSIPTLMIVREQIDIFRQAGALPEAGLDDLINQARSLDMEEVRASSTTADKNQ
ncbi:thioredoxin (plasmid) [Streptomyces scopuliridis]|uniref:Thioredoxin n=3 Tax=Streptomyces scopuliridis TaxID=452529 RepID=A0ACD4ZWT4_9ACTN|nr:thioredoxin [Streptomyces scopuliridis]WSC02864.1 thioredoxin [Streptomyces scopuliridis]WSC03449.1 thioredoxin [Streptomyces scopuliridis]WSC03566.1 thioredoxin [Streptomyces scopuliridis]WSC03602.1 thioredoxin [Streptomyces scopuliridis]WSC11290.1 thioredoxin [Streptomyces scopuliridis]